LSIAPIYTDEFFMKEALKEAQKAFQLDEVPVGVVIVANDKIIARGHNLTERLNDVTAHAEMQSITAAANALGGKYLVDCTVYVTLEPCVMCAGAMAWSQLSRLVIGTTDQKKGYSRLGKNILHPKTEVVSGVLAADCEQILKDFFAKKRK
jgi:tRNA(adenine34) deaminase